MIRPKQLKSGKVSYTVTIRRPGGRRESKNFPTKKEAKAWEAEEKAKTIKGSFTSNIKGKIFLKNYCEYFLEKGCLHLEPRSLQAYKGKINNYIVPLIGHKKLRDLTYEDGVALQEFIIEKRLSKKTNNNIVALLKQVLEFGTIGKGDKKVLEINPFAGLKFLKEDKKRVKYWSKEQSLFFLENCEDDFYADFYTTAINTGMRIGELAALQVKKIDFNSGQIDISNSLKIKNGGGFYLGSIKNNEPRSIPMSDLMRKVMMKRVMGKGPNDFLFTDERGREISIYHFKTRKFDPLQEKLGIKDPIRFHDLRHTYASTFMMAGGDLYTLKELLGHKKIESTQIYAHIADSHKQKAVNLVQIAPCSLREAA